MWKHYTQRKKSLNDSLEIKMSTPTKTNHLAHLSQFFARRFAPAALVVMVILMVIMGGDQSLLNANPWLALAWPMGMLFFTSVWLRSYLVEWAELETAVGIRFRPYSLWDASLS